MEAVMKGALNLAGRKFDTNQLKNLCAFLFRSERSADERRFFHWELEFPEVFFNETERRENGPASMRSSAIRLISTSKVWKVKWSITFFSLTKEWIRYGDWLAAPRERRFFTEERVLVQQIIDWSSLRILCGWTDEELYNTQNQFNLLAREGTNLKFILSVLNSNLMSFYHRREFLDVSLQRFQKVLIKDAKTFPIRHIEFTTPEKSRASLFAKSKQLYQRSVSDGNPDGVLAFVTDQLAAKPERADVVHDMLAFLAEQMKGLNREKRVAAKQFLTDLKDFHGVDIYALKPKTKLDKFWELEASEVFAHFRVNKLRLKDSDEEKIRARFQKAKDQLLPLECSRAFTDDLIDEMIYRLYALIPEEIATVKRGTAQ
jgi:hypothetical protein